MQRPAEQFFFEGTRYLAARDMERAEACFRAAVEIEPLLGEAHANLAWLLEERGADDEADAAYLRAVAASPEHLQVLLNYGAFLARRQRLCAAQRVYRCAIEIDPSSAAAWSNLAVACMQTSRFDEAEACCRRSLELDPQYPKAHVNLSYLCLRDGRLEEGWAHYEWRGWRHAVASRVHCPQWTGEPLGGRSLLIGHEGGHGDMVQFCRYAARLKAVGAGRIGLMCHPALTRLFRSLHGVDDVIALDEEVDADAWELWTSLLSLPGHLGTRIESIPAGSPYLHARPDDIERWRSRLPTDGLRVGLVWKGQPGFENDADRSLPSLDVLAPLDDLPGVRFISLQKGQGEDEALRPSPALPLLHLGADLQDFADTAAVLMNLDLVICVDTAVAHLAAALGKPCWLLLPRHMTDWRWLTERSDSPWYPRVMRLFRQSERGDWAPVVGQVRSDLVRLLRANGTR